MNGHLGWIGIRIFFKYNLQNCTLPNGYVLLTVYNVLHLSTDYKDFKKRFLKYIFYQGATL